MARVCNFSTIGWIALALWTQSAAAGQWTPNSADFSFPKTATVHFTKEDTVVEAYDRDPYLRISGEEIAWDFVRSAYQSPTNLAVLPLQDLLSLGADARFNVPGKAQGNWAWRYRSEQLRQLRDHSAGYLGDLADIYGRLPLARPVPT